MEQTGENTFRFNEAGDQTVTIMSAGNPLTSVSHSHTVSVYIPTATHIVINNPFFVCLVGDELFVDYTVYPVGANQEVVFVYSEGVEQTGEKMFRFNKTGEQTLQIISASNPLISASQTVSVISDKLGLEDLYMEITDFSNNSADTVHFDQIIYEHNVDIPYNSDFKIIAIPWDYRTVVGDMVFAGYGVGPGGYILPNVCTYSITVTGWWYARYYFIINRLPLSTGIEKIKYDTTGTYRVYNLAGQEIPKPEKGKVNIIKYEDGRVEKLLFN